MALQILIGKIQKSQGSGWREDEVESWQKLIEFDLQKGPVKFPACAN